MDLIELLKKEEGFRGDLYKCTAGALTIGYGHNLEARPITENAASVILMDDIVDTVRKVIDELPWVMGLDQARRIAILSMAFNMGIGGLLKFKKMLAALKIGNYEEAARESLASVRALQVPKRAYREAEMLRTGKEPK